MAVSRFIYKYYRIFVHFLHNNLFYNNFYVKGVENIPGDDTFTIVACNHQNCANDPIAIILSLPKSEKPYTFARSDVFRKSRIIDLFLKWLGLLPIFRLNIDGENALAKNETYFREAEKKLLNKHKLIIFPEAGHMPGHFLGRFSLGYLYFAFKVAKNNNFEKDIQILPCCNHYSAYQGRGNDLIIQYGKPISLKPFYDLYKIRPRTAQRAVNLLVRGAIKSMMLDIEDVSNYESIDFIRKSQIGDIFAEKLNKNYLYLPDRKDTDKQLVSILSYYREHHPEILENLFAVSNQVEKTEKKIEISENQMKNTPGWLVFTLKFLRCIFLFPLFLYSFIQCGLLYILPYIFIKKDKMFFNSIFFGGFVIIGPLLLLLSSILIFSLTNWQIAILWILTFPMSLLFLSHYTQYGETLFQDWKYLIHPHKVRKLRVIRNQWIEKTLNILNKNIESR